MRNLTKEEQESYSKSLDSMFQPTGVSLFDDLEKDTGGMPRYCYENPSELCPHYGKTFCISPCINCKNSKEFENIITNNL